MKTNKFVAPHPLNTAVLFLVFNRPEPTKQVFEAIKEAKPSRFYIAADAELILRLFRSNVKSLYIDKVMASFRDGGAISQFWITRKETFYIYSKYIGFFYAVKSFLRKSIESIRCMNVVKFKRIQHSTNK